MEQALFSNNLNSWTVFRFNTADPTVDKKARLIKYGPFKNVQPLTYEQVMLHYKSNQPMPIFH